MLKKFKKLGLALLLPATTMVIATPLVLTSCGSNKSLATNLEQNFEEQKEITTNTSKSTDKVVETLESIHDETTLTNDYLFPELIKEFVDYPVPTTPSTLVAYNYVGKEMVSGYVESSNLPTSPASNKFKKELEESTGLLNAAIQAYNLDEEITNIKIKDNTTSIKIKDNTTSNGVSGKNETAKPSDFTIDDGTATGSTGPSLSIPITVTFKDNGSATTLYSKNTHDYTLTIKPYITTFNDIVDANVGLEILYRSYITNLNQKIDSNKSSLKIAIETLYNEFSKKGESKESVFEQAITLGLKIDGGLISYAVSIEEKVGEGGKPVEQGKKHYLNNIPFIPSKIKGNYTFYNKKQITIASENQIVKENSQLTNNN